MLRLFPQPNRPPILGRALLKRASTYPRSALAVSLCAHLLVLLLILRAWNRPADPSPLNTKKKTILISLPPYARQSSRLRVAPPSALSTPPAPPPPTEEDTRPPEETTRDPTTAPGTAAEPRETEPARAVPPSEPVTTTRNEPDIESEAHRIFGPHPVTAASEATGPVLRTLIQSGLEGSGSLASNCRPDSSVNATGGEEAITIVGRILRQGTESPLPGAHLQMIGTPYYAFADGDGRYQFRFAASLVANCRTQLVRVEAPGYATQWLSVIVSSTPRSNNIRMERRGF
jgi:hypothetical protein